MQKDLKNVFGELQERYTGLRRSLRFTFWLRLTVRGGVDELWEINLWKKTFRKSRRANPPVEIRIPRSHFWALVEHSSCRLWRNAFENDHIVFSGRAQYTRRLLAQFRKTAR